ncbi:copper-binding protein [soil metagenome]
MNARTPLVRLRRFALTVLLMAASPLLAAEPGPWVDAEVRGINVDNATLTLRHGPIPNLQMDGMTMVFKAADPAWLPALKRGDRVRIVADTVDGTLTVTRLEPVR